MYGGRVCVTRTDVDVSVLSQLGKVIAQPRLPFRPEGTLFHLRRDSGQRLCASGRMLGDLQNDVTLPGTNRRCRLPRLQRKGCVLELFRQLSPDPYAEVATLRRGGTGGVCLGQILEIGSALDLCVQLISLSLSRREISRLVSTALYRDQDLVQAHRLGLGEIAQVLLIILVYLGLRELDVAPDLVTD